MKLYKSILVESRIVYTVEVYDVYSSNNGFQWNHLVGFYTQNDAKDLINFLNSKTIKDSYGDGSIKFKINKNHGYIFGEDSFNLQNKKSKNKIKVIKKEEDR